MGFNYINSRSLHFFLLSSIFYTPVEDGSYYAVPSLRPFISAVRLSVHNFSCPLHIILTL